MTDTAGSSLPPQPKRSPARRIAMQLVVVLYSLAIFATLDFTYSTFINSEASPRIAVKEYDHGLLPNFDGYARFGEFRYRFYTDNLGFRDFAVRKVPLKSGQKRVLLIGDSFTEGMAVSFDESYAGLLFRAGQRLQKPIEFLNASVASYAPAVYYKKIKYLLEHGLVFDEVVLFSDISDVEDEATSYFCIDDLPQYYRYCPTPHPAGAGANHSDTSHPDFAPTTGATLSGQWWQEHFVVSDWTRMAVKYGLQWLMDDRRDKASAWYPRAGWTIPGYQIGDAYAPLGIEGGVTRSLQNMQELADMLHDRNIPLSIVVYPWPLQLALNDDNSRQERIWRQFCAANCKTFIDLFPAFFSEKKAHDDWYRRLFIYGDLHPSIAGNRLMFEHLAKYLLPNG